MCAAIKLELRLPDVLLAAEAEVDAVADPFSLRDRATALRRGDGIMPRPRLLFLLSAERWDEVEAWRCKSPLAVEADMPVAVIGRGRCVCDVAPA